MSTIKVANAPCSWGVLEFGLEGKTAGYAQVLDEMSLASYAGTELGDWGFMPTDPKALKAALEERGLSMLGAFVPVALADGVAHEPGLIVALRTARLLAQVGKSPFIVLADDNGKDPVRVKNAGRIRSEHGLSVERWQTFAAGALRIAEAVLRETGLRTVFHHHCAGYVETPEEVDQLLRLTDPKLLGLCFDTGHYAYGGGDVAAALKQYGKRIWHVHFKDMEPGVAARARAQSWDYFEAVRRGVFCELGKGAVQFNAALTELKGNGYAGWIVVEQDVLPGMGTPLESARRNRAFLQRIGL